MIGAKGIIAGGIHTAFSLAVGTDVRNVHLHRPLPPEFVDLGSKGHIHHIALHNRGRLGGGGEINGRDAVSAAAQTQTQVLAVAHGGDPLYLHILHHQNGLGTAIAAGLQLT